MQLYSHQTKDGSEPQSLQHLRVDKTETKTVLTLAAVVPGRRVALLDLRMRSVCSHAGAEGRGVICGAARQRPGAPIRLTTSPLE